MARLVRWVVGDVAVQAALLALLAWLIPGFELHSLSAAILTAIAISVVVALSWPAVYWLATRFHPLLFPVVSYVLTALVVVLSVDLVNTIEPDGVSLEGFWAAILVPLGLTFANTLLGALFALNDDDAYRRFVLRPLADSYRGVPRSDSSGVIFIELDGLARPILEQALANGDMPTLQRWLESGSHLLTGWEPDLSSQTSASQAGILLGDNTGIPAFRWWDKHSGQLMVSSNMQAARTLEQRLSTGAGLLAAGGGSRFNVFSGNATDCVATFSKVGQPGSHGQRSYFAYFANPFMLARTLGLFVSDVVRERYQAWSQRARNVEPRIHRGYKYALVRAGTTVFLQEAGAFMLAADMLRGVPSVYCTFFAYDEVAHHSGIDRPDAFNVLRTLDRMIARLETVTTLAPRPYHLVVLSDHGQSQGATFKQRYGHTLTELVDRLVTNADVTSPVVAEEGFGQLNVALTEAVRNDTRTARLVRRAVRGNMEDGTVALGPESAETHEEATAQTRASDVVVLASGNLGLISFPAWKERMTFEQLANAFPGLVQGLADHPGVSCVLVHSSTEGGLVVGSAGVHYLAHGYHVGTDPLAPFGANAAAHLRRTDGFENVPDILVISMFDPVSGEVAAFEELVGSHGGLGGTQTQPFVLHPTELSAAEFEPIVGAAALHTVLKSWTSTAPTP